MGGTYGYGTIFEVTPAGAVTILHSFGDGTDGLTPLGGLTLGSDGNFYGVTSGFDHLPAGPFDGTIFRYTPGGVLTTLYEFDSTSAYPLVQGQDGNFYGVAPASIEYDGGVTPGIRRAQASVVTPAAANPSMVFRITPAGELTTLYIFSSTADGGTQTPFGKLVQGSDGNFYGVTLGMPGGSVLQMTPPGILTTLYTISGTSDAASPNGGLVQGRDGNFYGTTFAEDATGGDTVFQITPQGDLTTLHTFTGNDGDAVMSGLTLGSDGNFYGVTTEGGVNSNTNVSTSIGDGTIFQITPAGVLTTLYNFDGDDGFDPQGPLVQASNGLFYGTATTIGSDPDNAGYLYALAVSTQPAFFTGELALTNGVYYLQFPSDNFFGFYTFLDDPHYLYHFDLGYEYVFDARDSQSGVYLYDFASGDFFYTSPTFPFPYLFDFTLKAVLYYYPSSAAGHYLTDPRYFYDFATRQVIAR